MRTLKVSITDNEFKLFGFKKEDLSFSELIGLLERQSFRKSLNKSSKLAKEYNLAGMSVEDISAEVNAIRKYTK